MDSYLQIFLRGIKPGGKPGSSSAVAFTSTVPGEGVSYVTQSFAVELAKRTRRKTLIADIEVLKRVDIFNYSDAPRHCCETDEPYLYVLREGEEKGTGLMVQSRGMIPHTAGSELDQGLSNLNTLRFLFDFILVDCSSLKKSADAAFFASAVDGVILVVEADKTRKEQVRNAISSMEMAEANVLGCVLNKRRYPIPDLVYRRI